jgi:hypothetical protein
MMTKKSSVLKKWSNRCERINTDQVFFTTITIFSEVRMFYLRCLMNPKKRIRIIVFLLFSFLFWFPAHPSQARTLSCDPFYLKDDQGRIINPMAGQNTDQPYSPRQTCGACHPYDTITQGFHFQQGWDRIRDDFSLESPWILSDGMLGKQ